MLSGDEELLKVNHVSASFNLGLLAYPNSTAPTFSLFNNLLLQIQWEHRFSPESGLISRSLRSQSSFSHCERINTASSTGALSYPECFIRLTPAPTFSLISPHLHANDSMPF